MANITQTNIEAAIIDQTAPVSIGPLERISAWRSSPSGWKART
jgi:hypothetical protein